MLHLHMHVRCIFRMAVCDARKERLLALYAAGPNEQWYLQKQRRAPGLRCAAAEDTSNELAANSFTFIKPRINTLAHTHTHTWWWVLPRCTRPLLPPHPPQETPACRHGPA